MTAAPAVDADIRSDIPAVEVDNVSVRFGAIKALSEVSFTVVPGTIHAIIGPNGAGKSTMFNVLSGVYKAAEGQVRFGEHRLDQMRPHQIAGIGVARAFQNIALSAGQTVAENLMLGRHHLTKAGFLAAGLRLPRATREGKVHGDAGGGDRRVPRTRQQAAHARSGVLSYGDQKRVEVARALCTEPRLLLLDEPVAGMNAEETHRMAEAILEIRSALGISVVLVEHDMGMVMSLADRVTVLDFGRRIADGTPAEVQRDPEVIRAYLGSGDEIDPAGRRRTPRPVLRHPRDALVTQFLSLLLNGISLGVLYALIAMGFVIIFKASEVVSFTHGSLLLLGAYTIAVASDSVGFFPAVLVGIARHGFRGLPGRAADHQPAPRARR